MHCAFVHQIVDAECITDAKEFVRNWHIDTDLSVSSLLNNISFHIRIKLYN